MGTPQRIQTYMEKHKLTPLFEELMNKVLHEQPDDPYVYLIKVLYKKSGLEIPADIRLGAVRKSSPERIGRRTKSPEPGRKSANWASTSADDRSYERPWLTHSKKPKPRSPDEPEFTKAGRRQKQTWNADNKVAATSFDDLFESQTKSEEAKVHRKTEATKDVRSAWGSLGNKDDDVFRSSNYRGPQPHREEEDPLAGELMNCKYSTGEVNKDNDMNSTARVRGPKVESQKHRHELCQYLQEKDKHSDDSGYLEEQDEPDDAIELLEDADDLRREGVRNIPKSGYKLSKIMRQRHEEANVKLNINLYTGVQPQYSFTEDKYNSIQTNGSPFDSDQDDRPGTGMSGYQPSPGDSDDDEFESVSQVTGPRKPVWNVTDSDGESYNPKLSRTLPEPSRSRKYNNSNSQSRKLAATVPVRFDDTPYPTRSMESADSFLQGRETWSGSTTDRQEPTVQGSVRSESGGWQLPRYESDTSLAEWQYEGKLKKQQPPRAY